ncbi:MAG: 4-(cytidine 5'-diphospho)-2-C-methyl-D-erythritol kinase [Chloroflexi bacterium]|nr:4-(cytidine 5'-diphospho)-2-C-methyl-D-erythritol kinase [Chloroflexota bacterium]
MSGAGKSAVEDSPMKAHAKVNLTLEVLGRRPDGYHEVATVLQTVDLWDEVTVTSAEGLFLTCNIPELAGPHNLALRAAHRLREACGVAQGAQVALHKRIPAAAGLGGGSADAAATLRALSDLWGLGQPQLSELAAGLGSDVPFFLAGGTALASGRGERVDALPPLSPTWVVLLAPPFQVEGKTRTMYSRLTPGRYTDGSITARLVERLRRGEGVRPEDLFNVFDSVALEVFPGLERYWMAMQGAGAKGAHLVGAGPSLFALAGDYAEGMEIVARLWDGGYPGRLVCTALV